MSSRRLLFSLVCVVLIMSMLACGLPSLGGSKATATPKPAEPTNTPAAAAATATKAPVAATVAPTATTAAVEAATTATEAEATPTVAAEATTAGTATEGESVTLPGIDTSLEGVNSYSAVMSVSYRAKDQPETAAVVMNIVEEVDKASSSSHFSINGTDESGNPVVMESITIGQDSWISFGEGWMHTKADEASSMTSMGDSFLSQGDAILSEINNIRLVKKGEEVNGIVCDHYAWDETTFEETSGTGTASGEVWISQQDNVMVKMIMNAAGDFMGTDTDNVVDMTWELKSLNQPVNIAVPEGMSGADMLPVMDGAQEDENYLLSSEMAMYNVEASIQAVVDWYDSTLTGQGYTKGADASVTEEMASVTYTKDAVTLSLLVTTTDTDGVVSVILTKQ